MHISRETEVADAMIYRMLAQMLQLILDLREHP